MTVSGKRLVSATVLFNWVAAVSVIGMMILTCADVILRFFRRPIPGTYELVGFLGAIFVSFSLAYTSVERGHIAVSFLVDKLPSTAKRIIDCANSLVSTFLFGLITWQSLFNATDLKVAGEVSMTLQMPIYPVVYGIAVGCGLQCVVLAVRFAGIFIKLIMPGGN